MRRGGLGSQTTGNLDTASSDEVFALMRCMHAKLNTSFLIVTHHPRLPARCDRVLELVDGHIKRDEAIQAAAPGLTSVRCVRQRTEPDRHKVEDIRVRAFQH